MRPGSSSVRRVLVTGGAGFVGAYLSIALANRRPDWEVLAFDNLRRRGSELNLPRLREAGVRFVHGDVRSAGDLAGLGDVDAIVECSAEASVLAGSDGSTDYVVHTNLLGAFHCLEVARRSDAQLIFLSTSRVYPVLGLSSVAYEEDATRFRLSARQESVGVSERGISEAFPVSGARSIYGSTKLAAELLIEEYRETFGVRAVINRCGVLAGPGQMGKIDQGVFTYWVLAHVFRRGLCYSGFGGNGKQVRDLLHVDDLAELIADQLLDPEHWNGLTVNVGGGADFSLSLLETTEICRELTGTSFAVEPCSETRTNDIPIYISDCEFLFGQTDWRPRRSPRTVLEDIHSWVLENRATIELALEGTARIGAA